MFKSIVDTWQWNNNADEKRLQRFANGGHIYPHRHRSARSTQCQVKRRSHHRHRTAIWQWKCLYREREYRPINIHQKKVSRWLRMNDHYEKCFIVDFSISRMKRKVNLLGHKEVNRARLAQLWLRASLCQSTAPEFNGVTSNENVYLYISKRFVDSSSWTLHRIEHR